MNATIPETPTIAPWRSETVALLRLAGPLVISNLFFTIQISIDRLMLAKFDSAAAGAAFAAAMLFYAPFALIGGAAGFTSTFVAQYIGAKRPRDVGPLVAQAMVFSLVMGILFAFAAPMARPVTELFGHEDALAEGESAYLFWLCFCGLPMIATAAIGGVLAGLNLAREVIVINAVGCVVNAVLDVWWIFGGLGVPAMGIGGAGAATVVGSYAALAVGLALLYRPALHREYATRTFRYDGRLMRRFLSFALPSGMQSGFDVVAWALFTMMVGRLGSGALAATANVLLINAWFFVPSLGLAQAVCVRVSENIGARRTDLAERSTWAGFAVAGTAMTLLGIVVAMMPGLMISLFESDSNPAVWDEAASYIPTLLWFVAAYSFFDSGNLVFAFALRGAGDTRFVSLATLACGIGVLLTPCYLVLTQGGGVFALWTCATAYIASLAMVFAVRFIVGPWRSIRVVEEKILVEPATA